MQGFPSNGREEEEKLLKKVKVAPTRGLRSLVILCEGRWSGLRGSEVTRWRSVQEIQNGMNSVCGWGAGKGRGTVISVLTILYKRF